MGISHNTWYAIRQSTLPWLLILHTIIYDYAVLYTILYELLYSLTRPGGTYYTILYQPVLYYTIYNTMYYTMGSYKSAQPTWRGPNGPFCSLLVSFWNRAANFMRTDRVVLWTFGFVLEGFLGAAGPHKNAQPILWGPHGLFCGRLGLFLKAFLGPLVHIKANYLHYHRCHHAIIITISVISCN